MLQNHGASVVTRSILQTQCSDLEGLLEISRRRAVLALQESIKRRHTRATATAAATVSTHAALRPGSAGRARTELFGKTSAGSYITSDISQLTGWLLDRRGVRGSTLGYRLNMRALQLSSGHWRKKFIRRVMQH